MMNTQNRSLAAAGTLSNAVVRLQHCRTGLRDSDAFSSLEKQQPAQGQTWQLNVIEPPGDWCFAFLPVLHLSLIVNRRDRSETKPKGSEAGTYREPTKIYGVNRK